MIVYIDPILARGSAVQLKYGMLNAEHVSQLVPYSARGKLCPATTPQHTHNPRIYSTRLLLNCGGGAATSICSRPKSCGVP